MYDEEKLLHVQCLNKIYYTFAERNPSISKEILHFAVFDKLIKSKMFDIIDLICDIVEEAESS